MIMQLTQNFRSALHCPPVNGSVAAVALWAFMSVLAGISFCLDAIFYGGKLASGRTVFAGILARILVAIQDEQNPDRWLQSGRYRRH